MTNTDELTIFNCIYCSDSGPASKFDDEHVFSRALCGRGLNWTLINRVCKACNNRFSKFENELLQQAAETIVRGFRGPHGRTAGSSKTERIQPLKINHLYVQNIGDDLVYEGGFSFPSEFYFRPQMIDVGNDTMLSLVTDQSEIKAFEDALSKFFEGAKSITLPRPKNQKEYEIVTYENTQNHWRVTKRELNKVPSDVFFREIKQSPTLPIITSRLAQNDDGRLFIRADDLKAVGSFIDLMFANKPALPRSILPIKPGDQTFLFSLEINYIKVYKAVLKTGLNLVAHFFGNEVLHNEGFDRLRKIVLEDIESSGAKTICQMSTEVTSDFPKVTGDCHQMMIDEFNGTIRFRMRLYNHFCYTAILVTLNEQLRKQIILKLPKRILVDYQSSGIQEVQVWK